MQSDCWCFHVIHLLLLLIPADLEKVKMINLFLNLVIYLLNSKIIHFPTNLVFYHVYKILHRLRIGILQIRNHFHAPILVLLNFHPLLLLNRLIHTKDNHFCGHISVHPSELEKVLQTFSLLRINKCNYVAFINLAP